MVNQKMNLLFSIEFAFCNKSQFILQCPRSNTVEISSRIFVSVVLIGGSSSNCETGTNIQVGVRALVQVTEEMRQPLI